MIAGFTVRDELDTGNGERSQQEDMNEAPLVESKLQNEPNEEETTTNCPHS
jgi:hypothetical protein